MDRPTRRHPAVEWIEAQSCSSQFEIKASDVMIGK